MSVRKRPTAIQQVTPTGKRRLLGVRVQRLRESLGLSQADLARALNLSRSYLNQIEHNQRPVTTTVLEKLESLYGPRARLVEDDDPAALVGELRQALEALGHGSVSMAELRALASDQGGIARALIDLFQVYRLNKERADNLAARLGEAETARDDLLDDVGTQVRNYFNRRRNHIEELDTLAEAFFHDHGLTPGQTAASLRNHLFERHRVRVRIDDGTRLRDKRRFDAGRRLLTLSDALQPGQQAFQMAHQLALIEHGALIDGLAHAGGFGAAERIGHARTGLANYFAGALVMPYRQFLDAAEAARYDVERLALAFGVGFEAVCHRLSTLQRRGASGLPFFFMRVDRAGNVSKRHSATDFHFSHVGGSCPLWIVYEAFSQPGRVLTQVARMPDGRRHFWLARQVDSGPPGFGQPRKTFAVTLGCDLRHASRLVYSREPEATRNDEVVPIGPGCRICERSDCPQRAFPAYRR